MLALYRRFNAALVKWVSRSTSTIECAYVFSILTLLGLNPEWTNTVQFISSAYLQLVMLPILAVNARFQAEESDRRAQIQFDLIHAAHTLAQEERAAMAEAIAAILAVKTEEDGISAQITELRALVISLKS